MQPTECGDGAKRTLADERAAYPDDEAIAVVVDALGLPQFGGARSSAIGWIAAIARLGAPYRLHVFVTREEPDLAAIEGVSQHVAPVAGRMLCRIWAQWVIPRFVRRSGARLYHAMKNWSVVGLPCPAVINVNDLTHLTHAQFYPWLDRLVWKHVQGRLLGRANRIIAISRYTKHALERWYGLPEERITVIYPGISEGFWITCPPNALAEIRERYGLPQRYVLYVGGLGIHKNVRTLVEAYRQIHAHVPHGLVLVGGQYHTSSDNALLDELTRPGGRPHITLLDSVPDADMPAIYQAADLFVLPSLSEGFGLVLVEAMASGVPIVASGIGVMPEVVGDAARLVSDPSSVDELAAAMLTVLSSDDLRAHMSALGREIAQRYSWLRTVLQTRALYAELLATNAPATSGERWAS